MGNTMAMLLGIALLMLVVALAGLIVMLAASRLGVC